MKIKQIKKLIYSNRNNIQNVIIYNQSIDIDIASGNASDILNKEEYQNYVVQRIEAINNDIIITIINQY